MSVASVLERSGNVRDFREVAIPSEQQIWDKFTSDEIIDQIHISWSLIPFMGIDIYQIPEIREFTSFNKIIESESSKKRAQNDLESGSERFIKNMAIVRLLERSVEEDLDNELELSLGKKKINKIIYDCQNGTPQLDSLEYIFHFKVCFPSEDIDLAVESYLTRYPETLDLEKVLFDSNLAKVNKLKDLAYLKLLKPELLEGQNILDSKLYKMAFDSSNAAYDGDNQNLAGALMLAPFLKFFAAEKAVLGPHGIELTMPKSLALPSSPTLPEIGRFEG